MKSESSIEDKRQEYLFIAQNKCLEEYPETVDAVIEVLDWVLSPEHSITKTIFDLSRDELKELFYTQDPELASKNLCIWARGTKSTKGTKGTNTLYLAGGFNPWEFYTMTIEADTLDIQITYTNQNNVETLLPFKNQLKTHELLKRMLYAD